MLVLCGPRPLANLNQHIQVLGKYYNLVLPTPTRISKIGATTVTLNVGSGGERACVTSPRQLFEWASDNILAVFWILQYYKREQACLERFQRSRTIPGTRKLHSFVPISKDRVRTRVFSSSSISKEERVASCESELPVEQISGFVTSSYNGHWWVACVLQLYADTSEVRLTFLHPYGPPHSFRYPRVQDILTIPISYILTTVDPRTATGRVYTLTQKESRTASKKLKASNTVPWCIFFYFKVLYTLLISLPFVS